MIENQFLNIDQKSYMGSNQLVNSSYGQAQSTYYHDPATPFYYSNNTGQSTFSVNNVPNQSTGQASTSQLNAHSVLTEDKMEKKIKKSKEINYSK